MGYEIKVLRSDEFDKLPYEGIDDSLGFADVKSGKVFVRQTGSHDLNRYLINHEIDHLVEDEATHADKHGIRHKKFGDVLRHFYNPLNFGGLGPLSNDNKGFLNTDNASSATKEAKAGMSGIEGGNQNPQFTASGTNGPFGQFSVGQSGSSTTPSGADNSASSSLNKGLINSNGLNNGNQNGISPEILERIKGYYSGRIPF